MKAGEYLKLPYTKVIRELNDESGHYFYGAILELDGCQSTGETIEELNENLNEAMLGYFEVKIENNLPIPVPERAEDYSGKFVVRIPKTLHKRLAMEAKNEGVSLNQYAVYKLAR
ncbi:MAG: type II toxin-antitoxin system HicB family antitoxin [Lachnospiraceae bacterium]|nr:type II toxin-antitoxin system HicB family antitoxin [Lachnospiraceae bacterium]